MQSSAGLICVIIKFAAGVKSRKYNTLGAHALFVHPDRDTASVVLHGAGSVRLKDHLDRRTETGEMFIDGVVHDLIDQMIESPCGYAADIHAGPYSYGFKAFEHFNTGGVVIISFLIIICHANFLFLLLSCYLSAPNGIFFEHAIASAPGPMWQAMLSDRTSSYTLIPGNAARTSAENSAN